MKVRTALQSSISNARLITERNKRPEDKCICLLKSTVRIRQFNQILAQFFTNGLKNSSFLATKLIDFCNSARQMHLASSIFHQIPHPSSYLWTSMIRGFAQNGHYHQSIVFFADMCRQGIDPNHLTYPFVLKSCSGLEAFLEGEQIHTNVMKYGFQSDIYIMNCLLDMYSKCGFVDEARRLYDEMTERDIVSHTSMISGYFSIGDLASARLIFDRVEGADVVLWSAMVAGYTQNRCPKEALDMFDQMQSLGLRPNSVTMVGVISACSQLGDIERGRRAHDYLVRTGMEMNTVVSTSLLDMYIKCGFIDEARELFDRMPRKDVVSWNALINGYTKNGYFKEALEVFNTIQDLGLEPNKVTFLSALSSCAELGAIEKGKEIEELLNMSELGSDLSIETALLDMYAKCGSIAESYNVFRRTFPRDVVMWSAMINGFATNGHFKAAMSLFGGMLKEGMRPNNFTFLSLLIACAHGGLVHEAYEYLNSMTIEYGISPNMEHYACMVDLLGRAGLLEDAKKFIDGMPIEPGISVWRSLLGACTTHKNTKIGEYAAQHLFELEPKDDANYVLLSNIYAASGRWEDVEDTRAAMKHHKAHKTPGCSWIENGGKIHEFLVGGMLSGMELQ